MIDSVGRPSLRLLRGSSIAWSMDGATIASAARFSPGTPTLRLRCCNHRRRAGTTALCPTSAETHKEESLKLTEVGNPPGRHADPEELWKEAGGETPVETPSGPVTSMDSELLGPVYVTFSVVLRSTEGFCGGVPDLHVCALLVFCDRLDTLTLSTCC